MRIRHLLLSAVIAAGAVPDSTATVDLDAIRNWAGTGEKRAALVIDFHDEKGNDQALVWGYRWDGNASGEDMIRAIARSSRVLVLMTQYTGNMGSTVNGVGIAADRNELLSYLRYDFDGASSSDKVAFGYYEPETVMGQTSAPGAKTPELVQSAIDAARMTGIIDHPLNFLRYGYAAYDYDFWQLDPVVADSPNYRWEAAWYKGYWQFFTGDADGDLSYSGLGMSSVQLSDGMVNMWTFAPDFQHKDMSPIDYTIEDFGEEMTPGQEEACAIDLSKIRFWVGDGEKEAAVVLQFNDGKGPENLVYGYRWSGGYDKSCQDVIKDIAEADPRMTLSENGTVMYECNDDGNLNYNDHNATNGNWNGYLRRKVDTEYLRVADMKKVFVAPGSVFVYANSTDDTVELPFTLFRPASDDTQIIYLPETLTYSINDTQCVIPAFIQYTPDVVSHASTATWAVEGAANGLLKLTGTQMLCKVTHNELKPTEGDVTLKIRVNYEGGNADYVSSNVCRLIVAAPERPITSMSFESATMEVALNKAVVNPLVTDPENPTYTKVTYTTSDASVIKVNSYNNTLTATTTPGTAVITATYDYDPEIKAEFTVTSRLMNPVTDIKLPFEGNDVTIPYKGVFALHVSVEPDDADIADYNIEIADPDIVSDFGKGKYAYVTLVAHKPGATTVTLTAADGSGAERVLNVTVEKPEDQDLDFTSGTFILNEEWFGHTNGSINYVDADGMMHYRVVGSRNDGLSFGATSCYGMVWGGKLYVMSKQHQDGGDPNTGGGRLVVADEKTMKIVARFDNIGGGDGRACVGVNESKIYYGSTAGIFTFDVDNLTTGSLIEGTAGKNAYSGQIGDMVCTGSRVYAVQQSTGVLVIDTESDLLIKKIDDTTVQGIARSMDGNVWVASKSKLTCIDPATAEIIETVDLPSGQTITCDWGSWRPTQFFASTTENRLFWGFTSWEIGTDIATVADNTYVTSVKELPGENNGMRYGTSRLDERTGEVIVMTTKSYGLDAVFNTYHWVDYKTGEVKNTIVPQDYFWFQAMPVFPDAHDPEISLARIDLKPSDEPLEIDLADIVTDGDVNFHPMSIECRVDAPDNDVVSIDKDGGLLRVSPKAEGETSFVLTAQSNGKVVSARIPVTVSNTTGVDGISTNIHSITAADGLLTVKGCAGYDIEIISMSGRAVCAFGCGSDHETIRPVVESGIYIVRAMSNEDTIIAKVKL